MGESGKRAEMPSSSSKKRRRDLESERDECHKLLRQMQQQELDLGKLFVKMLLEAWDSDKMAKLETQMAKVEARIADKKSEIADLKTKIEELQALDLDQAEASGGDYFEKLVRLGAPPSLCKGSENVRKTLESGVYLCHIPPEAEPPFPLTLVHPAFANFVDRFNNGGIEFGNQDCEFVFSLCHLLADQGYRNEREMMMAFNKELANYLGQVVLPVTVLSFPTDGSCMSGGYMVFTVEGKKEAGNVLFQAIHYYGLFLSDMDKRKREKTFCPCFLLELVGVQIRISGLAFFAKVACQPFTPFMHCYINSYDKADMDSLCRAMWALKQGISELCQYYNSPLVDVDKMIPYPLQERQVQYTGRIAPRKLLFVVKTQSGELRLFKYCKRYGKEVHEQWAEAGFAPEIFDCRRIPGGWIAVEMEYLPETEWRSVYRWCNEEKATDMSGLQQAVGDALERVLNNTSDMAHGDMRAPNIMVRSVGKTFEIKFVDFDWAGPVQSTFYPSFINTAEKWHEGVGPGKPLSQDHDKWWADKWIQG